METSTWMQIWESESGPLFQPIIFSILKLFCHNFCSWKHQIRCSWGGWLLDHDSISGLLLKYSEQMQWNTMKADTKSSPHKQIHCNTSTVDTLSGNALTCLMMKPVQRTQCLKAARFKRWTGDHPSHQTINVATNKYISSQIMLKARSKLYYTHI